MAEGKLNAVYAVTQMSDDGEAICWYQHPTDGLIPLVGGDDPTQLETLKVMAKNIARETKRFTSLVKFSKREEVEEFSPLVIAGKD